MEVTIEIPRAQMINKKFNGSQHIVFYLSVFIHILISASTVDPWKPNRLTTRRSLTEPTQKSFRRNVLQRANDNSFWRRDETIQYRVDRRSTVR